ncbi:MAG: putative membrane protein insertion efficiency factor [candidate division TA06 bacterium ADurb.Bin131]|uniref:Putative membrane protein insertion efficiency factor n=1 Tax=candidate division TA06 bacterium ADurb.Bin131 TaxID=1852827 RepID=A0A1V6C486_UNCT6|nr:MAG: putative membrane protein insertion efficiency factor [candidate division TA06 bacterium ADurb.Bin131]HOC02334.1 membrane protein insertion efficiency factor YidD [bacterium]HPC29163.1 membrane protein insertion efficiency factor YidD [bacterium]
MERNKKKNILIKPVIFIIHVYQVVLSPIFGRNCRFYPSCSNYFIDALEKQGLLNGTILFLKRIVRCHPFNPGGYDPLPQGDK